MDNYIEESPDRDMKTSPILARKLGVNSSRSLYLDWPVIHLETRKSVQSSSYGFLYTVVQILQQIFFPNLPEGEVVV